MTVFGVEMTTESVVHWLITLILGGIMASHMSNPAKIDMIDDIGQAAKVVSTAVEAG